MIYEIQVETSVDLADFIKAIRREIECQNGVEDVKFRVYRNEQNQRDAGAILQDNEHFDYPHDDHIETAIRCIDKACDRRTCDDCPLSLPFRISHDLRAEPTDCVGVLMNNLYVRYQIDNQRATKK